MPPKKLTKKAKARLEAERKAREELEARQREEEERERERIRKAKEEEEAKRKLEQRIFERNKEVERFIDEYASFSRMELGRNQAFDYARRTWKEEEEWKEYMECFPNWPGTDLREINTFITESLDETDISFERVFRDVVRAANVVASLQVEHTGAFAGNDDARIESIRGLSNLVTIIVDRATLNCYSLFADGEESNRTFHLAENFTTGIALRFRSNGKHEGEDSLYTFFDSKSYGITVQFPNEVSRSGIASRACRYPSNFCSYDPSKPLNKGHLLLGGVICIDFLCPPSRKQDAGHGWKIRHITAAETKVVTPYLGDIDNNNENNNELSHRVKCTISYPADFIMPENLCIAQWNSKECTWTSDDIADCEWIRTDDGGNHYDVHFSYPYSGGFSRFSILHSRLTDLSYECWCIRPLSQFQYDIIEYSITTPRFTVSIHVQGRKCWLESPSDIMTELTNIHRVLLSPSDLLVALSNAGLHLIASDEDIKSLGKFPKLPNLERRFESDVALVIGGGGGDGGVGCVKSTLVNSAVGNFKACFGLEHKNNDVVVDVSDDKEEGVVIVKSANDGKGIGDLRKNDENGESVSEMIAVLSLDSDDVLDLINAQEVNSLPSECGNVRCTLMSKKCEIAVIGSEEVAGDVGDVGHAVETDASGASSANADNASIGQDKANNDLFGTESGNDINAKGKDEVTAESNGDGNTNNEDEDALIEYERKGKGCLFLSNCIKSLHNSDDFTPKSTDPDPVTADTLKQLLRLTRPISLC